MVNKIKYQKKIKRTTNQFKEKQAIIEYKDFLIKTFPNQLDSIILFGSKARHEDTKNSDIDLMILRNDNPKKTYDNVWRRIVEYSGEITLRYKDIDISPRIESKKIFYNTYSPFFDQVKKEGKILWSHKTKKNL